jgi:hypothetical protein
VTLPTPDAQSSKPLSPNSYLASATHSNLAYYSVSATSAHPASSPTPKTDASDSDTQLSAAVDFSLSWDLATGGLKTLTAKRELPLRQQRRVPDAPPPEPAPVRSYLFLLVLLACLIVMLMSGGVVLFITLQP